MKTIVKILAIGSLAISSLFITNVSRSQQVSVSFSVFYDNLKPYGRWVNYKNYGQVWIYSHAGFSPYSTAGHWVYTDFGWTWVSDYSWGWATFHYGRWLYDPEYGWIWIPGYEWGPAWVSWRTGADYYGWAPLGPDITIGIGFGSTIPAERWVFVPRRYIASPSVNRYYVSHTKNVTIIKNTTIINNTSERNVENKKVVYVNGPKKEEVERDAKIKVNTLSVNNSTRPGKIVVDSKKNTVNIYKPNVVEKKIENNNNNSNKPPVNQNNQPQQKPQPKPQPHPAEKPQPKPKPNPHRNK